MASPPGTPPPGASEFWPPSLQTVATFAVVTGSVGAALSYFSSPVASGTTDLKKDLNRLEREMIELRQEHHLDMTMLLGLMLNRSKNQIDVDALVAFVERVAPLPKTDDKDGVNSSSRPQENSG